MARVGAGNPDDGVELLWREGDGEPRPGLSLSRIVRVAIELADEEGLEGLSMRKVAERLGFTTMSLYRHVPGRDHLVDLMRDAVMGLPGVPPSGATTPPGVTPSAMTTPSAGTASSGVTPSAGTAPSAGTTPSGGTTPSEAASPEARPERQAAVPLDEAVRGQVEVPSEGSVHGRGEGVEEVGGWRGRLEACAREGWELRKRHPWLAEVRGTRRVPGPNTVAHYEYMLSAVAGTGLKPAEMIAVVGLVARFVDSEAVRLAEVARTERLSGVSEEEWWGARDTLYARLDRYPTLSYLWEAGGYDEPEDPFEFGLRRVLDGIEMLVLERDETRDESCRICGAPVERAASGRPRAYCSRACQQRAYRKRRSG